MARRRRLQLLSSTKIPRSILLLTFWTVAIIYRNSGHLNGLSRFRDAVELYHSRTHIIPVPSATIDTMSGCYDLNEVKAQMSLKSLEKLLQIELYPWCGVNGSSTTEFTISVQCNDEWPLLWIDTESTHNSQYIFATSFTIYILFLDRQWWRLLW